MGLSNRRWQSAAAKGRNRRRAAARQNAPRTERPCAMPKCRRLTDRPLGYCDACWEAGRSM